MKLDFVSMEETIIPHFKDGEKEIAAKMFFDGTNRLLHGRLVPGASIGTHCHDTSSEVIYILSGTATVLCDGQSEILTPGQCHYCPKGSTHTMKNNGTDDLIFFAVVPQQ
ncbi:MAG: cupin domain-containing protein [Oscillospiraceae bacterium]|nr:cupin domain-containing protein [Oscillospiraceae bacterium]